MVGLCAYFHERRFPRWLFPAVITGIFMAYLIIEPFRSAEVRARNAQLQQYFLSYNQTDDVSRAQDILTSLSFLKVHTRGRIELIGLGDAGVWCLFAAAAAPIDIELLADLDGFSPTLRLG